MKAGEHFGRLTTRSPSGETRGGRAQWLCACSCGGTKVVSASDLRTGNTVSCGCYQREVMTRDRKHGYARRSGKTPEYLIYRGIIKRCDNSNEKCYARYGGRGINVCDRWRSDFVNFLVDMGPRPSTRHSIDRKDTNGNYEPGNCRWATMREQQNNRANNRLIIYQGKALTLSQLAELAVVKMPTLAKRLDRGWSVEDAIALPASPISPQRTASRQIERRS